MIVEQNVSMVVSTCKTVEMGLDKCNQFWPNDTVMPMIFKVSATKEDYKVVVRMLE